MFLTCLSNLDTILSNLLQRKPLLTSHSGLFKIKCVYKEIFQSSSLSLSSTFFLSSQPLFGLPPLRHMKLYSEAAAVSNISVTEHEVTFDPDASWLKFHLGITRYALYSRDDPAIPRLLRELQSMTVINAGEGRRCDRISGVPLHAVASCKMCA